MFSLFKRQRDRLVLDDYIQILTDKPVKSWEEVSGRCQAVEALARLGPAAHAAMPALLRTLVVPVSVDCGLILRVAVAEALWKVDQRRDLALPFRPGRWRMSTGAYRAKRPKY
jgi:hypothetical protein